MDNTVTMAANGDSALQSMTDVIDSYIITDGTAKGLIKKADIDFAIIEALVEFFRHSSGSIEVVDRLANTREFHQAFSALHDSLKDKVWTGRMLKETKHQGDEVEKTESPITESPRCGMNYEAEIAKNVQERLIASYAPATPTLEHDPDAKRYLEICKALFPNVMKPHALANGMRDFIENIHNSCHTDGAEFRQKALWLYSLKTGGVGKSHFINNLVSACDRLDIDTHKENFGGQWLSPTVGFHTVTISEDTPKLASSTAETLNKLIDRSEFGYNIKFGASGNAQSYTTMLLASNYESYESNTRRYNQVEYLQTNLETLTNEKRAKYFPLWKNDDGAVELIVELFKVCPFKAEHGEWDKVEEENLLADATPIIVRHNTVRKVDVGTRYYSTLIAIQETLAGDYYNDSPDFTRMRPCKFAKYLAETYGCKREDALARLITFLSELKSKGLLRSSQSEGRTPIQMVPRDWTVFKTDFTCGDFNDNGDDPMEAIAGEWDALIKNEND